jgi:type IV pilus assembly protein PilC
MGTFKYTAKDQNGRTISGMLEASSESEMADVLHKKGLLIVSIDEAAAKAVKAQKGKKAKIKIEDIVVFARQLATMIDSGITLVQALEILGEQIEHKDFKVVIVTIRQDIEAGMNFCDALAKHPAVFNDFFVNMTKAGEASGMLNEVLDRLAGYLEKETALNHKIRSSLVYPIVVVSMSILITTFLLVKVVPTFKNIFESLGGQLPLPTQILILISEILRRALIFVVAFFVAVGFLFKKYIRTEKGRFQFDKFKLEVPVLGPLFRKVAIAKFSRTFSTLIRSGVAILSTLEIVAKTSGNTVIEKAVLDCRTAVSSGESLARPLLKSLVFPPMVCRMIGVGEQTGQLEKMLTKIAEFYEEEVDAQVAALTSLIEPLVIAFLGIVIGAIVIALFMPIFKLTQLIH